MVPLVLAPACDRAVRRIKTDANIAEEGAISPPPAGKCATEAIHAGWLGLKNHPMRHFECLKFFPFREDVGAVIRARMR